MTCIHYSTQEEETEAMSYYGMIVLSIAIAVGVTAAAADETKDSKSKPKGESPRQQVDRIFNETSPAIGQPLPDLTCLDADGSDFKLSSLKGKYTVLMFGCLT